MKNSKSILSRNYFVSDVYYYLTDFGWFEKFLSKKTVKQVQCALSRNKNVKHKVTYYLLTFLCCMLKSFLLQGFLKSWSVVHTQLEKKVENFSSAKSEIPKEMKSTSIFKTGRTDLGSFHY